MLEGKYLKYSPEITLEIFTLVCNKLIESGWEHDSAYNLSNSFEEFKSDYNYLVEVQTINGKKKFNCYGNDNLCEETTVQEILGYDPWNTTTEENFILPEKWCIKVEADGNPEEVLKWRGSTWYDEGFVFSGGLWNNCKDNITEITLDQFKKYVLKEPINAQNQPKSIEKWSVGSYILVLKGGQRGICLHTGDIREITRYHDNGVVSVSDDTLCISRENDDEIKWFATKAEAEEFAKTLVEPVKEEVKQPLKQAVHCTTQKEYKFLKEKISMFCENVYSKSNDTVKLDIPHSTFNLYGCKNDGYQILSFQEWCDLNGYKMENKCEFEVGKWYKINGVEKAYRKFLSIDSKCNGITYSEAIDGGNYFSDSSLCVGLDRFELASIKEIQQYLPDGHPDKITKPEIKLDLDKLNIKELHDENLIKRFFEEKVKIPFSKLPNARLCCFKNFLGRKCREMECDDCYLYVDNREKLKALLNESEIQSNPKYKAGDWVIVLKEYDGVNGELNKLYKITEVSEKTLFYDKYNAIPSDRVEVRHATQEEIDNHLISIGQTPTTKLTPWGIAKLRKDMTSYAGQLNLGNSEWSPRMDCGESIAKISEPKLILSIDDEELPMVNTIKTKSIKLLNND
jgi:hypothetical protein